MSRTACRHYPWLAPEIASFPFLLRIQPVMWAQILLSFNLFIATLAGELNPLHPGIALPNQRTNLTHIHQPILIMCCLITIPSPLLQSHIYFVHSVSVVMSPPLQVSCCCTWSADVTFIIWNQEFSNPKSSMFLVSTRLEAFSGNLSHSLPSLSSAIWP